MIRKMISRGLRACRRNCWFGRARSIHTVPEMSHLDRKRGIPGLFSPQGLDVAWFQYQEYLVKQLNDLSREIPEDLSAFELMRQTAESPELQTLNFYASQVYSNQFFFESLKDSIDPDAVVGKPDPQDRHVDISTDVLNSALDGHPEDMKSRSHQLSHVITESFDSVISFRELIINRANAIFGNGYVWLLLLSEREAKLVNTYNWGTPFSHLKLSEQENIPDNSIRSFSRSSFEQDTSYEVTKPLPLLSVNVWQHTYLTDYGVAGKRRFLENYFNCIDWSMVRKRLPEIKSFVKM
jgi:Fe-Mn family superoxide dismutase